MNWLVTYCDGSSGYKVSRLLTPAAASLYLQEAEGLNKSVADRVVNQKGRTEGIRCVETEAILFPVPEEATDDPGLDDEDE